MNRIIAAGHICLDITPVFPSGRTYRAPAELLEPGKLIRMEGVDVHTGGSVANTGLALKMLGNDVRLLGKIGADAFGNMIQSILDGYGVTGLMVDPQGITSYSVVLAVPGNDRIFLHAPGANDTFVSADVPDSALEGACLFHFGYPSVMKKMYEEDGAQLADLFCRAKQKGAATSLDLSAVDPDSEAGRAPWRTILGNVLPYVDFFLPSFEELCFMLDRPRYDRLAQKGGDMTQNLDIAAEVLPLADQLMEMGCRVVLIKCGTSGMIYRTAAREVLEKAGLSAKSAPERTNPAERAASAGGFLKMEVWADQAGYQPCFRVDEVCSGTGAGDTCIAAFLTAALEGKSPSACAALAAAQGACCVTAYDALSGLQPLSVLEERIRKGWETLQPS